MERRGSNEMRTFTRKGYGRIYVDKTENIEKVKAIIKEMDDFEYSYLPEKLVAPITEYPQVEYTHKFDSVNLDELTIRCYRTNIFIICIDNGHNEYMDEKANAFSI